MTMWRVPSIGLLAGAAALAPVLLIPLSAWPEEFPTKLECPPDSLEKYDENGRRTWCENADGTKDGPFLNFRASGESYQAGHYINGVLHGDINRRGETVCIQSYWYGASGHPKDDPSGVCPEGSTLIDEGRLGWHNERTEGCYRRDSKSKAIRHGPRTGWILARKDEPERKYYEVDYRDGSRHGFVREWRYGANLSMERAYRHDKPHGFARSWNKGGQILEEFAFERGVLHGRSRHWEHDGTLRWSASFENGDVVTSEGDFTAGGRACPDDAVPVGHRPPHGNWINCIKFEEDLKRRRHGPMTRWHDSGRKYMEEEYWDHQKVGNWRAWPDDALLGSEAKTVAIYAEDPRDKVLAARGVVLFHGTPVHKVTDRKLSFSFHDESDPPVLYGPRIVVDESRFEIFGLPPGRYSMRTTSRNKDSAGKSQKLRELRKLEIEAGRVTTLTVKLFGNSVRDARIRAVTMLSTTLFMPMFFAGVLTTIAHRHWSATPRRAGWWGMFLAVAIGSPLLVFFERPREEVIILVGMFVLMSPGALIGSWAAKRRLTRQAGTNTS